MAPRDPIEELFESPVPALKLVSDVAGRSGAICRPVTLDCFRDTQPFQKFEQFRIALISSRVFVKNRGKIYPVSFRTNGDIILTTREFDHFDLCLPDASHKSHLKRVERWCKHIKSRCKIAVAQGVDFIVFSELSYPNFWPGRLLDIGAHEKRRKLDILRTDLDQHLQDVASNEGIVIVSGSYHDADTFENLCHVYFPEPEFSCRHKKLTSARAVGEHVKLPRGVHYPIYNCGGLAFCVLICSDAFDLNIFFRQLLRPTRHPDSNPLIYFVPSYHIADPNKRHQLVDACQQLSFATGAVVIFVNQQLDQKHNVVFFAGEERALTSVGDISILDVDPVSLKAAQILSDDVRMDLDKLFVRGHALDERDPPPEEER